MHCAAFFTQMQVGPSKQHTDSVCGLPAHQGAANQFALSSFLFFVVVVTGAQKCHAAFT
jgi:hypothetical protein